MAEFLQEASPVLTATGMSGASADFRFIHTVELEDNFNMRERTETRRRRFVHHPAFEFYA